MFQRFIYLVLAGLLAGLAPLPSRAQGPSDARPSVEAFYAPNDIEQAAMSPSGRWLAITTTLGNRRVGLVIFDLQEWKVQGKPVSFADGDIDDCHWVNDDRLVFTITDRSRGGGDQRWWPGLFSVKRDGTELRNLVRLQRDFVVGSRTIGREALAFNHELIHVPAGGGDEVIVGEWKYDDSGDIQGVLAKRLDIVTGRATSQSFGAPAHVVRWLFDSSGEPRALVTRYRGRSAIHWRGPKEDSWRQLVEADAYKLPYQAHSIDSEGGLFVTQTDPRTGVAVLKRFDFAAGRPADEALVSAPGFDFQGRIVSETQGSRALGVRLVTDAETTVWWDKSLAALQKSVDQELPGLVNRLTCRHCGEAQMSVIVRSFSDREPGQIAFHDPATSTWRLVGQVRKGIDARQMGSTLFERIKARDGLELPLWITQPAGKSAGPRPAVVLVHGGPWVRGRHWQWDANAQFLASRGYLVIEPEFRGSRGYGEPFFRAGWRQWGRAMQDDVADALAWAVGKGLADPSRVCIAGAGYGGYATLMGLARQPELFRCGAAWLAVSDPRLLFEWRYGFFQWDEFRLVDLPVLIGDPKADAEMLDSVTPVLLARRMKAPLLLAYGGNDARVPLAHGERMRQALIDAGNPPQWVLYPDEGHGWYKFENRVDFAKKLEAFLAAQLQ